MSAAFQLLFLFTLLLPAFSEEQLIAARVAKPNTDANWDIKTLDFTAISNRLREARPNGSDSSGGQFQGPDVLRPLAQQCFLYDDAKYIFRVCPFANVTQHEKSKYAFNFLTSSFHAILGIWREWYVEENAFHSLIYLHGDQCEEGLPRRVRLQLSCSKDWTMADLAVVKNVTEIEKCVYHAELTSTIFCELGTIYSHIDLHGQQEWNVLETLFNSGHITRQGYEHYLERLLVNYGITTKHENSKTTKGLDATPGDTKSADEASLCSCQRIQQLEREISQLKMMLQRNMETTTSVQQ